MQQVWRFPQSMISLVATAKSGASRISIISRVRACSGGVKGRVIGSRLSKHSTTCLPRFAQRLRKETTKSFSPNCASSLSKKPLRDEPRLADVCQTTYSARMITTLSQSQADLPRLVELASQGEDVVITVEG